MTLTPIHDALIVAPRDPRLAPPELAGATERADVDNLAVLEWEEETLPDRAAERLGGWFLLAAAAACAAGVFLGFEAAIAALTALGFAAAVVGIQWRFLGLLGTTTLCVVDPFTRVYLMHGGVLRWNTFNYWLLLVAICAYPQLLARRDWPSRLLRLLFVLITAEILLAPVWQAGLYTFLVLAAPWGLLVYFLRARGSAGEWFALASVGGTVAAASTLVFYLQRSALGRIDENALAYVPLTGALVVCLGLHFHDSARRQWLLAALAAVNASLVFLSGSRGSCLVALICGLYVVSQVRGPRRRVAMLCAVVALGAAVTAPFAEMRKQAADRVAKLFDADRSWANRTSGRSELAWAAWRIFREHPLGVGTGGFPHHLARLQHGPVAGVVPATKIAHSAWVKVLSENGLPGFALLAAYVGSFAISGWLRHEPRLWRLGVFAGAVLAVGFLSQEFIAKGLWFVAAGAMAILAPARDSRTPIASPWA